MAHKYTTEQIDWLRKHYPKLGRKMTMLFNAKFGTEIAPNTLVNTCKRYKIKSGRTGRFEKNNIPFNLGKYVRNSEHTEFKPGHTPHNYAPVGSHRINTLGYHQIKTQDPNVWEAQHKLLWESANGPVPKNAVVIFIDGDKNNLNIENLTMVTREELARINKTGISSVPNDLRKTHIAIARLDVKIHQINRHQRDE